jgi:phosphoserine aminotransferase
MCRDLDQTLFLIGACFADSGIRVDETLNNPGFEPHPAVADLLDWMSKRGGSEAIRAAAAVAQQLYAKWLGDNQERAAAALREFGLQPA